MPIKAVILVGGETLGTRFRPLTMDQIKVLFPIAGKPLLGHIIDGLHSQLGSELQEVLLISFYKDPNTFNEFIASTKVTYPHLKISVLTEPYSLGTGGGIYYFRNEILGPKGVTGNNKILMIHGDVVCDYPFRSLVDFYESNSADVAILGIDPLVLADGYQNLPGAAKSLKFYDKDQIFASYGTIISNKGNSKVVHYVEKPKSDSFAQFKDTVYSININGGVYLFNDKVFRLLEKAQEAKSAEQDLDLSLENDDSDKKDHLSFELDVFKTLPSQEDISFVNYKSQSVWYQLKTPIYALLANGFFLKHEDSLVPSSPTVRSPVKAYDADFVSPEGSIIGPNVSIGKNVKLGKGIRLKNCIIADNVTIDDHSIIANAIVSKGVKVGKWCRIEGTINTPTVNREISSFNSDNYLKLINNIVVLCRDTLVGNQVFVYNSIVLPHKELKSDVKYEIVM